MNACVRSPASHNHPSCWFLLVAAFVGFAWPCGASASEKQNENSHAADVFFTYAAKKQCDRWVPGFKERSGIVWDHYVAAHTAAIAALQAREPSISDTHAEVPNLTADEMDWCSHEFISGLERSVAPSNPKYSTPQKTWAALLAALRVADRAAALDCFDDAVAQKFRNIYGKMSDDQLRGFAENMIGFVQTDDLGNLQGWEVVTRDRKGFAVHFELVNGEWLITEM